jgi:hypothetical protein
MIVKDGGAFRVLVNGQQVIAWTDPDPIAVDTLAVGGAQTRINFCQVEIRALGSNGRYGFGSDDRAAGDNRNGARRDD